MTEVIDLPCTQDALDDLDYWYWVLYQSFLHMVIFGGTGAGKTCALFSIVKQLITEGWKIVVVYSPKKECRTMALPGVFDKNLHFALERWNDDHKTNLRPHAFDIQVKIPLFKKYAYSEHDGTTKRYLLPWMVDYFVIPLSDLNHEEAALLLTTEFSASQRALLSAAQWILVDQYGAEATRFDLIDICQKIAKEGGVYLVQETKEGELNEKMFFGMHASRSITSVAQQLIFPFAEGFIDSITNPLALDLKDFINNTPQTTICAFEMSDVPYWELKRCIVAYLSRKIFELKESGNFNYDKICLVYLELADIVPAKDERGSMVVKNTLKNIIRLGRQIGIKVLCDTQLPNHVDKEFLSQLAVWYIMRLNNKVEFDNLCKIKSDALSEPRLCEENLKLNNGEGFLFNEGYMAGNITSFAPLLAHHLQEGENFIKYLKYYWSNPMPLINKTLREYLNPKHKKKQPLRKPIKDVTHLVTQVEFNIVIEEHEKSNNDTKKAYIYDLKNQIDLKDRRIKELEEKLAVKT